jgi:hypothetical protein
MVKVVRINGIVVKLEPKNCAEKKVRFILFIVLKEVALI